LKKQLRIPIWFAVLLLTLVRGEKAEAAVIRVPEDYPTVVAGIDVAASGDSVLVGPGTWTDKATRNVLIGGVPAAFTACGFLKGGIAVIGTNGANATILDAGSSGTGAVCVFIFANYSNQSVAIEGITITGGVQSGLFGVDSGKMNVLSCKVSGNSSPTSIGAGIRTDGCSVTVEDSEISFNNYPEGISGISVLQGHLSVRRCVIEGNDPGGVGASAFIPGVFDPVIEDCTFVRNQGGALGLSFQDVVRVERNLFLENVHENATNGQMVTMFINEGHATVRFNTIARDSCFGSDGVGSLIAPFNGEIAGNTFFGCYVEGPPFDEVASAVALYAYNGGELKLERNIFASCNGGPPVYLIGDTNEFQLTRSCNVFWDHDHVAYGGWLPTIPPDIEADPLFCAAAALDFTIQANSPCAPQHSSGCGQIGAWPVGCGAVNVEATSWGKIKSLYR